MAAAPIVTRENVEVLTLVYESLLKDKKDLLKKVKRYPIELRFEGQRFFLRDEEEFEALLGRLKSEIDLMVA